MKAREKIIFAVAVLSIFTLFIQHVNAQNLARSIEKEFIRFVEKASPSIVGISAIKPINLKIRNLNRENIGTGIIIDPKGYIVTTESVIGKSNKIKVTLSDGRDFNAKVIGIDRPSDIAVLKINAEGLPTIGYGNSDNIKSGSWMLTIGKSRGKFPTVSFGMVNGVEPFPDGPAYYDIIRINADVSSGNSGGAVLDMDGKLVAILNAVFAEPRIIDFAPLEDDIKKSKPDIDRWFGRNDQRDAPPIAESLFRGSFFRESDEAFAVPINYAKKIIDELIVSKSIERGWLGVYILPINNTDLDKLGLNSTDGAMVAGVKNNTPAYNADIQEGDAIIAFNGKKIKSIYQFTRLVADTKPNTKINLTIIRDKKSQIITVEIGKMPKDL